jgi:hypothetical protein
MIPWDREVLDLLRSAPRFFVVVTVACGNTPAPTRAPVAQASAAPLPSVTAEHCDGDAYQPEPAWSGRAANLPAPPTLPSTPLRDGAAYTVYGAVHTLHSASHLSELNQPVTIAGVIVDTNLPRAPKCVLHRTGRADPENCTSEIPAFTIADDAASTVRIRVLGWASNFANVYEAYLAYRKNSNASYVDELWATTLPNPLPAVGAKVRVTGKYGTVLGRASSGVMEDRRNGIMTFGTIVYEQPPTTPARFPQLGP